MYTSLLLLHYFVFKYHLFSNDEDNILFADLPSKLPKLVLTGAQSASGVQSVKGNIVVIS